MYNSNITVSLQMYFWVSLRIPLQCTWRVIFEIYFWIESSSNLREFRSFSLEDQENSWLKMDKWWNNLKLLVLQSLKRFQSDVECARVGQHCKLLYGGYWTSALYTLLHSDFSSRHWILYQGNFLVTWKLFSKGTEFSEHKIISNLAVT